MKVHPDAIKPLSVVTRFNDEMGRERSQVYVHLPDGMDSHITDISLPGAANSGRNELSFKVTVSPKITHGMDTVLLSHFLFEGHLSANHPKVIALCDAAAKDVGSNRALTKTIRIPLKHYDGDSSWNLTPENVSGHPSFIVFSVKHWIEDEDEGRPILLPTRTTVIMFDLYIPSSGRAKKRNNKKQMYAVGK